MPLDPQTVLTSAGVSAVVAVYTAGVVAHRKARADRDVAARQSIRDAVRPVQREVVRWARLGASDRKRGVAMAADAQAVAGVLAMLPDLPGWRRFLVRRRLRKLFGPLWVEHMQVFEYDPDNLGGVLLNALLYEHRAGGVAGPGVLTDGLVHRTLTLEEYGGRPGRQLDRQLRRLAACW